MRLEQSSAQFSYLLNPVADDRSTPGWRAGIALRSNFIALCLDETEHRTQ